jgi:hypothetical protein
MTSRVPNFHGPPGKWAIFRASQPFARMAKRVRDGSYLVCDESARAVAWRSWAAAGIGLDVRMSPLCYRRHYLGYPVVSCLAT